MNQSLRRIFTTAVLVSATGVPFAAHAEENSQISSLGLSNLEAETLPEQSSFAEPVLESSSSAPSQDWDLADFSDSIEVISHSLEGRSAATLSVHSIPVFTFVDLTATDASPKLTQPTPETSENDAIARSLAVGRRLESFQAQSGDPEALSVRWDDVEKAFIISMDDEALVAINDATLFSGTVDNEANDALQATNRLRYLLGARNALTEVEGMPAPPPSIQESQRVFSTASGQASWYGPGFHGRRTASGEVFNQNALTAAHRTLPFGTLVRVTNLSNDRQVVVRINDRGPYAHGRIIDLSAGAARAIGLDRAGVGSVNIEVLSE
jgi:rare lipoprotein A